MHLNDFSKNIVIPYGYSGSGKSELGKVLRSVSEENGYKLVTLGSGDCFRETLARIKSRGDEMSAEDKLTKRILDETMEKGEFVPTLHPVISKLQSTFKDYIVSTLKGEKTLLILDGFFRVDKNIYTNDRLGWKDVHIPSQFEQVSEVFARALREVVEDEQYRELIKKIDPELLSQIREHTDTDLLEVSREGLQGVIADEVFISANHSVIDVTPEDAEVFMRCRASKSLTKISEKLNDIALKADGDGRFAQTKLLLEEATAVLTGNFEIVDGDLKTGEIKVDEWKRAFSKEEGVLADSRIQEIAEYVFRIYGQEFDSSNSVKFNLKTALDLVHKEASLIMENPWDKKELELRADDLLYRNRETRIGECKDKTMPGILRDRLGFDLKTEGDDSRPVGIESSSTVLNQENCSLVENRVNIENSYSELQRQSNVAGNKIFRHVSSGIEFKSPAKERG